jgi:SpoVK/Ycf46/Vps4 family AAA+-type ATPase
MAERKRRVFLVATANDISRLPPELVRKGRFDEIFFVDLPDAQTRMEIFRIHLQRRNVVPDELDLSRLVSESEGFSGAEIEQAVVSSLYEARALAKPLGTELVSGELRRTRPLSVTMAERIDALREWAAERTVPAQ